MKTEIVPATYEHVTHIACNMRPSDVSELASLGLSPWDAVIRSMNAADKAWTGLIDGEPVCMFGVSPVTPFLGRPWMMGTMMLDDHSMAFLRRCRPQVERIKSMYPQLENWVAAGNESAIMWLQWLGFTILPAEPFGLKGELFHKFRMETLVNHVVSPKVKQVFRKLVTDTENYLLDLGNEGMQEPVHRFADGLYCRELFMMKDSVWVSKVHKHSNFAFVMTGVCDVVTEHGVERVVAPRMFKTEPGTKRMLVIHEDSLWITVHAKPDHLGENIEDIEEYITCNTLDEYDDHLHSIGMGGQHELT